jgi:hypothetical protein
MVYRSDYKDTRMKTMLLNVTMVEDAVLICPMDVVRNILVSSDYTGLNFHASV